METQDRTGHRHRPKLTDETSWSLGSAPARSRTWIYRLGGWLDSRARAQILRPLRRFGSFDEIVDDAGSGAIRLGLGSRSALLPKRRASDLAYRPRTRMCPRATST